MIQKNDKKRELKPDSDKLDTLLNPLLGLDFKVRVTKWYSSGEFKLDEHGKKKLVEKQYESDKSCKLYVTAEHRKKVLELSNRAKSLFLFISYELESGKDYIWIPRKRCMRECNMTSVNTFKDALVDLIDGNFIIASSVRDVYWINPRLLFNGSRINKYSDNVLVTNSFDKKDK